MITFSKAPINTRNELGSLLVKLNLVGVGVEIGTHRGEFAERILRDWSGQALYCVDPYLTNYDDRDSISRQDSREEDRQLAYCLMHQYKETMRLLEEPSDSAYKHFADESLDFVYVDGSHTKASVSRDLELWWPKLKSGGMMAGHDILCPDEWNDSFESGIQQALFEFPHLSHLFLIVENFGIETTICDPWSFYFFK